MGEIGVNRLEYLYELSWLDLILIERGYDRRCRHLWSATRWQAYELMSAQMGGQQMRENGIHSPLDLLKFPWEKNDDGSGGGNGNMPDAATIAQLRQMMMEENAKVDAANAKKQTEQ